MSGNVFASLIDRIARNLLRRMPRSEGPQLIWEGVYQDFEEVPRRGDGFTSETWQKMTVEAAKEALSIARFSYPVPPRITGESSFLPAVASTIVSRKGQVVVLDVGGGLGVSYVELAMALPESANLVYHIVENVQLCGIGRELYVHDERVRFSSELPDAAHSVDIVYLKSSLQYNEDYRGLLRDLGMFRAPYLLIEKTPIGDVPTFATAQTNVEGSRIPYWFLNIDEILATMDSIGYKLILRSAYGQDYFQDNFPGKYRLKYHSNLMFAYAQATGRSR